VDDISPILLLTVDVRSKVNQVMALVTPITAEKYTSAVSILLRDGENIESPTLILDVFGSMRATNIVSIRLGSSEATVS
jgi:hypothetical protein